MNIILYIFDGLRPDFLKCYGFNRDTSPNVDLLAKDGVLYENVYSSATWTKTAAVSILTSQFPRSLRSMYETDIVPDYQNSLPKILRKHGFKSYAVSASAFFSSKFGFTDFDYFYDLPLDKELLDRRPRDAEAENQFGGKMKTDRMILPFAEDINQKIFPLLDKNKGSSQNFIMAFAQDTHGPFFLRDSNSFFSNSVNDFIQGREVNGKNLDKVKSLYCDMIRYNDYHLGQLITKLKNEGLYEDSLIIITADHGESFGEHKWILGKPIFGHSDIVYEEVIKVPLIIKYPQNKFAGERYSAPVQLVDIYPTISDVVGVETKEIETEGHSLNPSHSPAGQERIIFFESQINPVSIYSAAVRIGDKKLIKTKTPFYFGKNLKKIARNILEKLQIPSLQFYDLSVDPKEQRNLASKRKNEVGYFLKKYDEIIEKCNKKAKAIGSKQKKVIDEEIKKRLQALGYLND